MTQLLSVNINQETANAILRVSENHGINITEAVRRIVSIANFIEKNSRKGRIILIHDPKTGKSREMVIGD